MVVEFNDVVALNNAYQQMLAAMAEYRNTNDDILGAMLSNLMHEYNANLKLLEQRRKFDYDMFVRNKKMLDKQELIKNNFELKKMKFMCRQEKRANRLLFAEFKKQNNVKTVADNLKRESKGKETTAVAPVDSPQV